MLDKLMELSKWRMETLFENGEDWYQGASMYIDEMHNEINEARDEMRDGNAVYLEDELGDVMWDYLCLLRGLEHEGKIDSVENVRKRAHQKFSERFADYPKLDRDGVKKKQKSRLLKEHQTRYGR